MGGKEEVAGKESSVRIRRCMEEFEGEVDEAAVVMEAVFCRLPVYRWLEEDDYGVKTDETDPKLASWAAVFPLLSLFLGWGVGGSSIYWRLWTVELLSDPFGCGVFGFLCGC